MSLDKHSRSPEVHEALNSLYWDVLTVNGFGWEGATSWVRMPDRILEDLERRSASAATIERVREAMRQVVQVALGEDRDLFIACEYIHVLKEPELIQERLKTGIRESDGRASFELKLAALRWGDKGTQQRAIAEYREDNPQLATACPTTIEVAFISAHSLVEKTVLRIREEVHQYEAKYKLVPKSGGFTHINAAAEIQRSQNYDLAVGVLNSGALLANHLEVAGQETRYLEWHRRWKKNPTWRRIGKNTTEIRHAARILICENDISEGTTMEKILPYIDRLNPEQVDLCLCGHFMEHSLEMAEKLSITKAFPIGAVPLNRVFDNFDFMEQRLREEGIDMPPTE